jgi:hypothetical protein
MASLILRIVSLFMGRLALVKRESLTRHRTAKQRQILTQTGWPDAPESVAGSDWNEWPDQIGIPGRMSPECANNRHWRYNALVGNHKYGLYAHLLFRAGLAPKIIANVGLQTKKQSL